MQRRELGRCFVRALNDDLHGLRDRQLKLEQFIIFQTVILKCVQHVTASHTIRRRVEKRINAWEVGQHGMIVYEMLHTCTLYLTTALREESEEHRAKTYHSLVLLGKIKTTVHWITEREMGSVLHPEEH